LKTHRFSLRPGEWGDSSLGVTVLLSGGGFTVVDQPPSPHPDRKSSKDLADAIDRKLQDHPAPSLERLFPYPPHPVYDLDCGGPTVLAGDRSVLSRLREDYGSNSWTLSFLLLSRESPDLPGVECSLPIAKHRRQNRSLVSHRTGKKAHTVFRRIHAESSLQLWRADTHFLRPDQIRLHALESGILIAGESTYTDIAPLNRGDLPGKRRPGGPSHVLFHSPAIHLSRLTAPLLPRGTLSSDPPRPMAKWIAHHGVGYDSCPPAGV